MAWLEDSGAGCGACIFDLALRVSQPGRKRLYL
jgi:hypothetical protein